MLLDELLAAGFNAFGLVSEEADAPPYSERQKWNYYWLVDPLDGTRDFINGSDEFTINIALMQKKQTGGKRNLCTGGQHSLLRQRIWRLQKTKQKNAPPTSLTETT